MGNYNAAAMAEAVGEGLVGLRPALSWHLSSNHYPPVPSSMIGPCIDAIEAAVDEDWDREITLPADTLWKGKSTAPASAIVEDHHLEFFVEAELYGDESEEDES